jgi:hypothetical protein
LEATYLYTEEINMSSDKTTLSLVNFSGKDISSIEIDSLDPHDWDYEPPDRTEKWRPDFNFTGPIKNLDARCEREEINAAATEGSNFTMTCWFQDQSWIRFAVNQRDALSKLAGNYEADMSAANNHLEVYRLTGKDSDANSNSFYIREATPPDNSNWMRQLMAAKPDVKLNQITMPGSHDAGMYVDNTSKVATGAAHQGAGDKALTQRLSIAKQLSAGARYFDLRVYYDRDGVLWAYHGQWKLAMYYGGFGGKFEDILEDVFDFFNRVDSTGARSEEVVILRITPYVGAANLQATVDMVDSKLGDFLYKNQQDTVPDFGNMTLAALKGKVIATYTPEFFDVIRAKDGGFPNRNCGDEKTGALLPVTDPGFTVYDVYADKNSLPLMESDQSAKLNDYAGYEKPYLFLLSWTLTGSTSGILDLELLSRLANPQLPKKLRRITADKLPNIVNIDYVNGYLCSAIIALNYNPTELKPPAPVPVIGVPVLA